MPTAPTSAGSPRTVAILIDHVGEFQTSVLSGASRVLAQHGFQSIALVGREIDRRDEHAPANELYRIINPADFAGFVVLSGAMGHFSGEDRLAQFLQALAPRPLVSIGQALPGHSSVTTDNETGMRALMQHLVELGHRRFAFMRGFSGNYDSQLREQVFRESLNEKGIVLDEQAILTGNYDLTSAYTATRAFVQQGRSVDVFVAANDDMALGIIQALNESGLHVPSDVAVTGFDCKSFSASSTPPLTTIRQPFAEMGEAAARLLVQQIDAGASPARQLCPSQLVLRQSCGAHRDRQRATTPIALPGSLDYSALKQHFSALRLPEPFHDSETGRPGSEVMLRAFITSLATSDSMSFVKLLRRWMAAHASAVQDADAWQNIVQGLQRSVLATTDDGATIRAAVETGMQAERAIHEYMRARWNREVLLEVPRRQWLDQVEWAMAKNKTLNGLMRDFTGVIERLGYKRLLVALYDPCDGLVSDTLRVAWTHGEGFDDTASPTYPAVCFVGPELRARFGPCAVVHPLYHGDESLGILVVECDAPIEHIEQFRQSLSRAIHIVLQSERVRHYATSLEKMVQQRTSELEISQVELLQRLADVGEHRDNDTGEHSIRVGDLSARIADRMGLADADIALLRVAARLHDIGKVAIPDRILLKPGTLDPDERRVIQMHAQIGADILSNGNSGIVKMAEEIARTHHEWWDGTGYPNGLCGQEIPLLGRIVAVADAFDALTSDRPYRPAYTPEQALEHIVRGSGTQFDPEVVRKLAEIQYIQAARAAQALAAAAKETKRRAAAQGHHHPADDQFESQLVARPRQRAHQRS